MLFSFSSCLDDILENSSSTCPESASWGPGDVNSPAECSTCTEQGQGCYKNAAGNNVSYPCCVWGNNLTTDTTATPAQSCDNLPTAIADRIPFPSCENCTELGYGCFQDGDDYLCCDDQADATAPSGQTTTASNEAVADRVEHAESCSECQARGCFCLESLTDRYDKYCSRLSGTQVE